MRRRPWCTARIRSCSSTTSTRGIRSRTASSRRRSAPAAAGTSTPRSRRGCWKCRRRTGSVLWTGYTGRCAPAGAVTVADLRRPQIAAAALREVRAMDEPTRTVIRQGLSLPARRGQKQPARVVRAEWCGTELTLRAAAHGKTPAPGWAAGVRKGGRIPCNRGGVRPRRFPLFQVAVARFHTEAGLQLVQLCVP